MSNPKQKTCFVIRPFHSPYDKRHNNIFKPAIEDAGLEARLAGGPGVSGINKEIKDGIRNAHICFADISEDNPDIWYEVGFAFACGKEIAIVCNADTSKPDTLLFGVQPDDVILYKESIDSNNSDNQNIVELRNKITCRIKKLSKTTPPSTPQPSVEDNTSIILGDLTREDFVLFLKIMKQCVKHGYSLYSILSKKDSQKNNQEDLLISILNLTNKGYVVEGWNLAQDGISYFPYYKITDKAMALFLNNKGLLFNM